MHSQIQLEEHIYYEKHYEKTSKLGHFDTDGLSKISQPIRIKQKRLEKFDPADLNKFIVWFIILSLTGQSVNASY